MDKVLIIGASGHAKVIIDVFEKMETYQIVGLVDDNLALNDQLLGYPVLGSISALPEISLRYENCYLFIAIGDNWTRHLIKSRIDELYPNAHWANAIHPSAQIGKEVKLGMGIAILAGAIVGVSSLVEDFTIINTQASLDHDGKILKFASLAPGVVAGGNVRIGSFSAILINASIKNSITVGKHSIVAAGALVIKDCGNQQVLIGSPAKEIRSRKIGEKYLS